MSQIILKGGRVIDSGQATNADVAIDTETKTITDVAASIKAAKNAEVIDVSGCLVTPGLVDLHANLGQPGDEAAETITSGTAAAAAGGYTAIVAMPNTSPCADSPGAISDLLSLSHDAVCEVVPAGALSVGQKGFMLAPIAEMVELGVRIFTDNAPGVQNARFMRRALEYVASITAPDGQTLTVAQHCEVGSLAEGGVIHEGTFSTQLGLPGKPAEAEEIQVMRDIALARLTGVRVHLNHITTAGSVAMVRAAKAGGVPITAAVAPQYFTFIDADCAGFDPLFRVDPPLRTSGDVAAIAEGIADGSIDAITSDHMPRTPDTKELPFDQAAPGSLGLETTLAAALSELDMPIEKILAALSWKPARLAGLARRHGGTIAAGNAANLCVIDPDVRWTVRGSELASKATNTIFSGRELKGRARHTIYRGELVVRDSKNLQGAIA